MSKTTVHPSITLDRVIALNEQNQRYCEDYGICLECGEDNESIEPDAQRVTCDACGAKAVNGAEEILVCNAYVGERGN